MRNFLLFSHLTSVSKLARLAIMLLDTDKDFVKKYRGLLRGKIVVSFEKTGYCDKVEYETIVQDSILESYNVSQELGHG
jgi:hypothetical protein